MTFFRWRDGARLAEAVCWLGVARVLLLALPLNAIAARLGKVHQQSPATLDNSFQRTQARRVGYAVTKMSRYVPWDSACLAQALAAKWMLGTRQLPSTLYLGVAFDENKKMLAHAWLRCGDVFVTGAPQHTRFTVVATFTHENE